MKKAQMDIKTILILGVIFLCVFVAFMIPYTEIGDKTNFSTYDHNASKQIIEYQKNISYSTELSKQTLDSTKNINSSDVGILEIAGATFDTLGTLIKSGFTSSVNSVKMLDSSIKATEDLSQKVSLPDYIKFGIFAIIFILIGFALISILTGRA